MQESNPVPLNDTEHVITTTCKSHCGGVCPILVHVKNGVITRIEAENEIKACVKGRAYRQRVYAPDRIKYPMKRVGDRGAIGARVASRRRGSHRCLCRNVRR